ncbi:tyrosine-type recombinase/integrase [Methanosarcina sp. KYL-1]|uniref:tyrosine-type recombinase/integrase n=1 Tax=Methanosarcina sp. KYL-1 TaxID=2602068 RepID=UPI002101028F|nr:tyrosine-type recombinase/integrase [Methanosarcina sp. KYL-1]MCQ1534674.1 tyrosine-type recombinase/integrase [Methanosarcina sp. KYL-1]
MGIGIYNISVRKRLESLNDSEVSDINKKFIFDFVDYCFSEGLSKHRVLKYISILKSIAIQIQLDFDKVEKKDLYVFISDLEKSDKSEWVKHDYKISLKKFYRWQRQEESPELTKWIKTTLKKKDQKLPEEMLTESEVLKLIENAESARDRAIVALLWDIGARIGEIGTLTIRHLSFDQYGAIVNVKGKTGYRRVRAVWSVEYLKAWLEVHPEKYNLEAPLWVTLDSEEGSLRSLRYDAIRMKLKRLAKKSGINKKIHPHLFRHSRCTYMANYLTEAQMNAYFGWIQGSNMPSVYVHLSGRDVDDAILKANGIIGKGPQVDEIQKRAESPKLDLSSIIESKVSKLVEAKIAELLGS